MYVFVVTEPRISVFFTMVNRSRFGIVPNTAFSMESDCAGSNVVDQKFGVEKFEDRLGLSEFDLHSDARD